MNLVIEYKLVWRNLGVHVCGIRLIIALHKIIPPALNNLRNGF